MNTDETYNPGYRYILDYYNRLGQHVEQQYLTLAKAKQAIVFMGNGIITKVKTIGG